METLQTDVGLCCDGLKKKKMLKEGCGECHQNRSMEMEGTEKERGHSEVWVKQ